MWVCFRFAVPCSLNCFFPRMLSYSLEFFTYLILYGFCSHSSVHWLLTLLDVQAILFNYLLLKTTCTNCHTSFIFLPPSSSWNRISFSSSLSWVNSFTPWKKKSCLDLNSQVKTECTPKHVTLRKNARCMWTILLQLFFLHYQVFSSLLLLFNFTLALCRCWVPVCTFSIWQQRVFTANQNMCYN